MHQKAPSKWDINEMNKNTTSKYTCALMVRSRKWIITEENMIKREVKLALVHHLIPWLQLQPGLAPRSPQDTPRLDLELLQQYSVLGEAVRLPQMCSFGPKGSHLSPKMTCISALDQIICRGCPLIVDSLMAIWSSMSNFKGFAQHRPWGTRTKHPFWSPCV